MNKTLYFLVFVTSSLLAQPKVDYKVYQAKYPNIDVLTLNVSEKINIEIVNGKIDILNNNAQDIVYLSNRVGIGNYSDRSIGYSPFFSNINNIEAATYIPNSNNGFKKINSKDVITEKETSRGVFYDDRMTKKVTFLGLTQGAVSSLKYQEQIKDPHMLGGFLFGNYMPIENAEFSVTFPAEVKVSYRTFGDFSKIDFKELKTRKKTTYIWKAKEIKEHPIESSGLNIRYYVPQVQLFIENYIINGTTTEVLFDEKKLFNYYVSLVKDINTNPDKELIALADSLTSGKTKIEKIKSVYYWVQDHVKYIAFEDGMGGFVPRQANDVCRKRYGDCKDMASLITTLLRLGGVTESYLCWIGTREIPFKYKDNASMGVDNHMIAVTKLNDKWYFLDATDDRIDFGLPTNHIQGKEGMVMLSENEYKIVEVPIVEAKINARVDSVNIEINGDVVNGKGTTTFEGLWKTQIKYYLSNYSEKQKQEYAETMFKVGNNKCKVSQTSIFNQKNREAILGFNYNFKIPDYIKIIDNEIFINPHLFKHQNPENKILDTRKTDFEHDFTWQEESVIVIEIPQNYAVSYLPKKVQSEDKNFGFEISYRQTPTHVILNQRTYNNTIITKKEEFAAFNSTHTQLLDAYSELISFKKIN